MIQEMWQGYVIVIMINYWTAIIMRDFQGYKLSLIIIDEDQASMIFRKKYGFYYGIRYRFEFYDDIQHG